MTLLPPDTLRGEFCSALSAMYRKEVPLYGDLVDLVDEVNRDVCAQGGTWEGEQRLRVERHGAIRLGKPSELHMIARLFRIMGMHPVGYYDLSPSGVPVHATAFRPLSPQSLDANPFRVFTSLLRPDLIPSDDLREQVLGILEKRDIFHPRVYELVDKAERQGGALGEEDAKELVRVGMETFRWHEEALVSEEVYERMKEVHPLLADVVGFKGPHINHLTPRVLDIDAAQAGMKVRGIPPKQIIEGPPQRECPILLRQTSFQALTEPIRFPGGGVSGSHRARFGEIESRGVALTRKGHELYLCLMDQDRLAASPSSHATTTTTTTTHNDNDKHQLRLSQSFTSFPDSWRVLRVQQLAYFRYTLKFQSVIRKSQKSLDELIDDGIVVTTPIVYEDFLPASAAGIFQSNLGEHANGLLAAGETQEAGTGVGTTHAGGGRQGERGKMGSSREVFEKALGIEVHDYFALYEQMERESIEEVVRLTGCRM